MLYISGVKLTSTYTYMQESTPMETVMAHAMINAGLISPEAATPTPALAKAKKKFKMRKRTSKSTSVDKEAVKAMTAEELKKAIELCDRELQPIYLKRDRYLRELGKLTTYGKK